MTTCKYERGVNIIWSQDPDVSFQTKLTRARLVLQRKENENHNQKDIKEASFFSI